MSSPSSEDLSDKVSQHAPAVRSASEDGERDFPVVSRDGIVGRGVAVGAAGHGHRARDERIVSRYNADGALSIRVDVLGSARAGT